MNLEKTLLFVAIVFGAGLLSLFFFKGNAKSVKLLMSFTGAYILGITFMHLVPAAYHSGGFEIGLLVIGGFLLQLLLEGLSKGVEHGHFHHHGVKGNMFAFQVLIGLSIHSFIEGMPLASGFEGMIEHHHGHGHSHNIGGEQLFWGIIAHHIPASMALGALFISAGFSKWKALIAIFVFTMMTPIGAWSTSLFTWTDRGFSMLLALVIGTFLHISTTILFELEENHRISWKRMGVIILGLGIAIISSIH